CAIRARSVGRRAASSERFESRVSRPSTTPASAAARTMTLAPARVSRSALVRHARRELARDAEPLHPAGVDRGGLRRGHVAEDDDGAREAAPGIADRGGGAGDDPLAPVRDVPEEDLALLDVLAQLRRARDRVVGRGEGPSVELVDGEIA